MSRSFETKSFETRRGAAILLFDDDFDQPEAPPAAPEPEIIEPLFNAAELEAAREAAAREARETALAEAEATSTAIARAALSGIAAAMTAAAEEAAAAAEAAAASLARLLLDCFAAAFPALSARHGQDEAAAVLRAVLPALHREPKITVRVNPRLAAMMAEEIEALDPDLAARVKIIPTGALADGDTRVAWEDGAASRDTKAIWAGIESILAPAGLLSTAATAPPASPPSSLAPAETPRARTVKEPALVH